MFFTNFRALQNQRKYIVSDRFMEADIPPPAKNHLRDWRMRGEHLYPDHVIPTFRSGYQCVSPWTCISKYEQTSLVGYCDIFTQTTYRSVIQKHPASLYA